MKTAIKKIKKYGDSVDIIDNNNTRQKLLNIMIYSFVILAFAYVFVIGNMVFNIVERKSLEADARVISNEVGDLELEYLSMSNNIDIAYAESLGFKESKDKKFATRRAFGSIKLASNEL